MLTIKFDFDAPMRVKLEGLTGWECVKGMTLKELLNEHFMVEVPARTFARKMKNNGFVGVSEDLVIAEAELSEKLSILWKNDVLDEHAEIETSQMNVLMLLCHALELLASQNAIAQALCDTKK